MSIGINYDCYSTKSGYYTAVNTTDTDAAVPNGKMEEECLEFAMCAQSQALLLETPQRGHSCW